MLGKTAGGLYWMFRFLERSENTARLIEAGFRIALTRSSSLKSDWKSVVTTAGVRAEYDKIYDTYVADNVIDYLVRDTRNPSSVLAAVNAARMNARMVRTALTTEVWEAVNENWMAMTEALRSPIPLTELPALLGEIRRHSALVRGALHGTMLRNDIYHFAQIGTAIERADYTARIIDVKYYTLLPSTSYVGSPLDNVQWETILRSVSAHRSFRWLGDGEMTASAIAQFLILDGRFPRSLYFSYCLLTEHLSYLAAEYDASLPCHDLADMHLAKLGQHTVDSIFDEGLHDFISAFLRANNAVGLKIQQDYRFNG